MALDSLPAAAKLAISIIISLAAGGIGVIFTSPAIGTWYAALNKPGFTPPNWLFGPAWTTLYILMGIAAFFVLRQGLLAPGVKLALLVFLVQLILNILWSVIFFGYHQLLGGIVVIVLLWIAILITLLRFWNISTVAGALLIPYLAWVTFASALNIAVWILNR
jgi:benzodiazapine receptor